LIYPIEKGMGQARMTQQESVQDFSRQFKSLTEHEPLSWQTRLYRVHFLANEFPSIIDLPTGLGKTVVMAIWLIALEVNMYWKRRFLYFVDCKTVLIHSPDLVFKIKA